MPSKGAQLFKRTVRLLQNSLIFAKLIFTFFLHYSLSKFEMKNIKLQTKNNQRLSTNLMQLNDFKVYESN